MKPKLALTNLFILCSLLASCNSGENSKQPDNNDGVITKNEFYISKDLSNNALINDENVDFNDRIAFNKGSANLNNVIMLPIFESASQELNFKIYQ